MKQPAKTLMNRFILFVVLIVIINVTTNVVTQTVGPVVTDEIALAQMNDTDAGHAKMRAYTATTNTFWTYFPIICTAILGPLLLAGPVVKCLPQKETKNQGN